MKVKNIIIAQDRYSILGGISTVNKLLGRAFDEAGYNVSYMALFDNTAGHPDAIEPDFVVNSGPLIRQPITDWCTPIPVLWELHWRLRSVLRSCGIAITLSGPAATCGLSVKILLF